MTKGIIMEKNRTFMVVMTPDGLFQKARLIKNASIGSEVSYIPIESPVGHSFLARVKKIMVLPRSIFTTICLLFLLMGRFFFIPKKTDTYAYVAVDINPSLAMEIDKKAHINNITAINEDAALVIDKLGKVLGESLEYALSEIINKSEAEGLTKSGKHMLVGVSYVTLKHRPLVKVKEMNLSPEWEVVKMIIPAKIRKAAREKHMSMNQLLVDSIEGNPEQLSDVDAKEEELIHLFYHNKFHHVDQHSNVDHLENNATQQ